MNSAFGPLNDEIDGYCTGNDVYQSTCTCMKDTARNDMNTAGVCIIDRHLNHEYHL